MTEGPSTHTQYYKHAKDPGEPSTGKPRCTVTIEEASVLALHATGKTVLEIGTGLGLSTRALASTAASVTTVDIDEWVHEVVVPAIHKDFPAVECLRDWPPPDRTFDLIFIDGDHSKAAVQIDTEKALPRVAPNGAIIFHDVLWADADGFLILRSAMEKLPPGAILTVMHTHNGLAAYEP